MRTNIVLDDQLVRKTMVLSRVTTKREAVRLALQEYVQNHGRLDLRDIRGKVKIDPQYDHQKMREAKVL